MWYEIKKNFPLHMIYLKSTILNGSFKSSREISSYSLLELERLTELNQKLIVN